MATAHSAFTSSGRSRSARHGCVAANHSRAQAAGTGPASSPGVNGCATSRAAAAAAAGGGGGTAATPPAAPAESASAAAAAAAAVSRRSRRSSAARSFSAAARCAGVPPPLPAGASSLSISAASCCPISARTAASSSSSPPWPLPPRPPRPPGPPGPAAGCDGRTGADGPDCAEPPPPPPPCSSAPRSSPAGASSRQAAKPHSALTRPWGGTSTSRPAVCVWARWRPGGGGGYIHDYLRREGVARYSSTAGQEGGRGGGGVRQGEAGCGGVRLWPLRRLTGVARSLRSDEGREVEKEGQETVIP